MQIFHSNLRFKHQPGPIPLIKNIMVLEVLIKMNISLTALLMKQSSLSTDLAHISSGPAACQLGGTCSSRDYSKVGKEGEGSLPVPALSIWQGQLQSLFQVKSIFGDDFSELKTRSLLEVAGVKTKIIRRNILWRGEPGFGHGYWLGFKSVLKTTIFYV